MTPIFRKKIVLACLLLVMAVSVSLWRWQNPGVITGGGLSSWVFMTAILVMFGLVVFLGHYGGMLVFDSRRR